MKQKKKAPCAKGQLLTSVEAIQLSEDKEAKKKEDNEKTEENRRVRVRNKTQKWTRAIDEIFSMYQRMETLCCIATRFAPARDVLAKAATAPASATSLTTTFFFGAPIYQLYAIHSAGKARGRNLTSSTL